MAYNHAADQRLYFSLLTTISLIFQSKTSLKYQDGCPCKSTYIHFTLIKLLKHLENHQAYTQIRPRLYAVWFASTLDVHVSIQAWAHIYVTQRLALDTLYKYQSLLCMPKTSMRTPRSTARTRCLVCAYDKCIKCSNVIMYAYFSALKLKIYTRLQIKHACRIHSSDYITLSDLYMRWVLKHVTSTCEQTYIFQR